MTADAGVQELLNERDYEIGSLKLEIERLRAALKLYASNQTWDRGEAARKALGADEQL